MRIALLPLLIALPASVPAQRQATPPAVPDSVEVRRDVVYAQYGQRAMKGDLYLPRHIAGAAPAVVYVHGGGWKSGTRVQFAPQAIHMAKLGYVGLCIEYRLSKEAKFPAAIQDVKAAVRYLRAQAGALHIDPARIGAAGGSAGGHLVALLGVSADRKDWEGDGGNAGVSSKVQAVAGFNPAVDLASFGPLTEGSATNSVQEFLGASYKENPGLWKDATATTHVTAQSPPMLFLHGDADTTVPIGQSQRLAKALRAAGVRAEVMVAPGAAHGFFNKPPWFEPTLKRMEEFFQSTLGKSEKSH